MGLGAIKQELREVVLLPMALPQLFTGIRRPQCNLLFYGVPGTGAAAGAWGITCGPIPCPAVPAMHVLCGH